MKKKITEMAWATSFSSASITGAVAAMAEPPQMEDPTPTKVATLPGMFIHRLRRTATTRDTVMVHTMMGSDWRPV